MFFTVSDQNYHAMQSGSSVTRLVLIGQPGKSKRRPIKSAQIGHKVHQNCLSPTSDLNRRLRQSTGSTGQTLYTEYFFSFFLFLFSSLAKIQRRDYLIFLPGFVDFRKFERLFSAFDERRSPRPPPNTLKWLNSKAAAQSTPFKQSLNVGLLLGDSR